MLPAYLGAFALTLAVEVPVYVVALTALVGTGWARATVIAVGVNVVTHPALWWGLRPLAARPAYPALLAAAELVVCVVEWALLVVLTRRPGRTRADLALLGAVAVAANAASTLAGLLRGG
ncbi:MAG TPA: hypothetical protein VKB69_01960 [Micromonosporaceae bacterium]|nr:hypothetical protein [Micromonosporaceae bacterium]